MLVRIGIVRGRGGRISSYSCIFLSLQILLLLSNPVTKTGVNATKTNINSAFVFTSHARPVRCPGVDATTPSTDRDREFGTTSCKMLSSRMADVGHESAFLKMKPFPSHLPNRRVTYSSSSRRERSTTSRKVGAIMDGGFPMSSPCYESENKDRVLEKDSKHNYSPFYFAEQGAAIRSSLSTRIGTRDKRTSDMRYRNVKSVNSCNTLAKDQDISSNCKAITVSSSHNGIVSSLTGIKADVDETVVLGSALAGLMTGTVVFGIENALLNPAMFLFALPTVAAFISITNSLIGDFVRVIGGLLWNGLATFQNALFDFCTASTSSVVLQTFSSMFSPSTSSPSHQHHYKKHKGQDEKLTNKFDTDMQISCNSQINVVHSEECDKISSVVAAPGVNFRSCDGMAVGGGETAPIAKNAISVKAFDKLEHLGKAKVWRNTEKQGKVIVSATPSELRANDSNPFGFISQDVSNAAITAKLDQAAECDSFQIQRSMNNKYESYEEEFERMKVEIMQRAEERQHKLTLENERRALQRQRMEELYRQQKEMIHLRAVETVLMQNLEADPLANKNIVTGKSAMNDCQRLNDIIQLGGKALIVYEGNVGGKSVLVKGNTSDNLFFPASFAATVPSMIHGDDGEENIDAGSSVENAELVLLDALSEAYASTLRSNLRWVDNGAQHANSKGSVKRLKAYTKPVASGQY